MLLCSVLFCSVSCCHTKQATDILATRAIELTYKDGGIAIESLGCCVRERVYRIDLDWIEPHVEL